MVDCIAMSSLGGIYRSIRLEGQVTSPKDKKGYHGITSILNYHIWSCLSYEILTLAAPPLPLHPRAPGEIEIDLRRGQRPPRMRRGSL